MTIDEAKEFLTHNRCSCENGTSPTDCDNPKCKFGIAVRTLCNEERPKGKWNYIQAGMCVCPFCGAYPHKVYKNFCPHCGADMREADYD